MAALAAIFALGALMAVAASALPTILPETVTAFTGKKAAKSAEAELLKANGEVVTCEEAKGENGTVESNHHLGLFHISFTGCKAFHLFACTGLGDSSGVVLSLGSWHLVYDTLKASLSEAGVAILFLPGNTHFECVGKLFIVKLGGMILCLILNPTALTKVFEFHCNKSSAGNRPEETKYYNEAGALTSIVKLETAENEGTAEESTEVALGTIEYNAAVLIMI